MGRSGRPPSRRIPGFRLSASLSAFALTGCLYGFAGGGLPDQIRTVAVIPFENLTTDPGLSAEIDRAVREAMQDRLGLRPAGESQADAIVRGSITRYEPDLPVAFTAGEGNRPDVTKRQLQIVVSVEIIEQRTERIIWKRDGLMVNGDYDSGKEAEGRRVALQRLVTSIVEGAQSQW